MKGQNKLFIAIIISLVLGVAVGAFVHFQYPESAETFSKNIKLLGTIFIRLVQMIIAPLVFTTLVVGIAKMSDMSMIGRVGTKAMLWFITASLVSLMIGLVFVNWDMPTYVGHSHAEVFRFNTDVVGSAVKLGASLGVSYPDRVNDAVERYYWVRFVNTNGTPGPFHALNGILAGAELDPGYLLDLLEGQLTASQLHADLGSRIDLIDADASVPNSVAYRVAQEAAARGTAISNEATVRDSADDALAQSILSLSAVVDGNTAAIQSEATTRATADSALSTRIDTIVAQAGGDAETILAAITQEQTARIDADSALSSSITNVQSVVNTKNRTYLQTSAPTGTLVVGDVWYDTADNNRPYRWSGTAWVDTTDTRITANVAAISSEATTRANADSALSSRIDAVVATANGNTAAIQSEATTRAAADSANAGAITTLQTTVGGHTTSIQTLTSTTDGLSGKYAVKIDNNGYVTGFGLASVANNGAVTSTFAVRADSFYIANPEGPGVSPAMPFIVRTTPVTIGGETVAAGVYVRDAFIQNGTISTAKLGNAVITSAKIAMAAE